MNHDLLKHGEKPCRCDEECTSVIETIEIAHTFQLGNLFTKKFGAKHRGQLLIMNCFGIGIGNLWLFEIFAFYLLFGLHTLRTRVLWRSCAGMKKENSENNSVCCIAYVQFCFILACTGSVEL